MKIIVISPKNRTTYNFRGNLIRDIIARGHEVVVIGPDRDNLDKIQALGVKFVEIPMRKNGMNPLADIQYAKKLYKLFKVEQPDVTFGYTVKPVIYGAIAAKLAGVKHKVSMVTGLGYVFTSNSLKAKLLRVIVSLLYRIGFLCADTVVFQNNDDQNQLLRAGLLKAEKCETVNGSGVDMDIFQKADFPVQTTFFMLSRLLKSKGVAEYLAACEKVKQQYPDVHFALLGKYEYEMQDAVEQETVERLIREGIIDRYEETNDVRPYYKACSVYVLPSYREGTPRTVLEAMAMGRPIITTDAPGCRETVIDGENGFLVPVKDVDTLAEKMVYFIEHPKAIFEMGQNSIEYCKDKFEVIKVNKDMRKYLGVEENEYVTV